MNDIEIIVQELHNILEKDEKINKVYDPKDDKISLSIIPEDELDIKQLKINFLGTINYLYHKYVTKTNYSGGKQADIVDCLTDLYEKTYDIESESLIIDTLLLVKTYTLILFFSVTAEVEGDIENLMDNHLKLKEKYLDKKYYYRGQNDYSFSLIPSFYRKDKNNFPNGITIIDEAYLKRTYKENGKLEKYKNKMEQGYGYGFLAFMQHTYCYSPYLDFTSSSIVALTFGIKATNKDGSIYVLDSSGDVSKYRKSDKRRVIYSTKRLNILDRIGEKRVFNCTYLDFEPMIRLHKKRTNDRMKYQKGIFMDIYRAIIIDGVLLLPVGTEKITKYRIFSNGYKLTKKKINKIIAEEHPEYTYEKVMNPYDEFTD